MPVEIDGNAIDLNPNEHASFTIKGTDQYGQPSPAENSAWTAPGCTVGQDGKVTVGDTPGLYVLTVCCGHVEAEAQIRVLAPKRKKVGGDEPDDPKDDATKTLRWSGTLPPQKWMTFYTKVVSPFASTAGLKLRVEIEVPADVDPQQAKVQVEKIKSALRDQGLSDLVDLI